MNPFKHADIEVYRCKRSNPIPWIFLGFMAGWVVTILYIFLLIKIGVLAFWTDVSFIENIILDKS